MDALIKCINELINSFDEVGEFLFSHKDVFGGYRVIIEYYSVQVIYDIPIEDGD